MLDYVKLALLVMRILQMFLKKAADAKLIDQGRADVIRENLEKQNAEILVAYEARRKVRDGIASNPDSVYLPDKWEK